MRLQQILPVLACLCPLASAQTDAGLWRFVHPNAKALIGIDVQRIRSSRVVEEMSAQLHALPMPMGLPVKIAGLDLIHSIDRVIVSSPGRDAAHPNDEPPILVAVSGHFEPVKLGQMFLKAGAHRQVFNSVVIYRPQDQADSDFGFAVLNSQTMVIGDVKSLFTVIERAGKGDAAPPAIVERARDMDVAYDFWAILLTTPAAMASDRLPMMEELAGKLKGFQAGIAVRDGLAVDVNLNAITEKAAKEMSDQFSKLIHLAAKDREAHPEWAGLDRKMKVTVDRSDVHFALRLDARELTRVAKAFDAARTRHQALTAQGPAAAQAPASGRMAAPRPQAMAGQPAFAAQTPAPALPQPLPATAQQSAIVSQQTATAAAAAPAQQRPVVVKAPERQVIRIEGLDDGPREIPYRPTYNK